jgi:hypothetical protein
MAYCGIIAMLPGDIMLLCGAAAGMPCCIIPSEPQQPGSEDISGIIPPGSP